MQVRAQRVAKLIKEEVSILIRDNIKDPRVGFVTITKVEVTKDLKLAKIYFSEMDNKEGKTQALEGLQSAKGYIKKLLAGRIKLRFMPDIIFVLDKSSEYSIHIEEKIDDLKKKGQMGK